MKIAVSGFINKWVFFAKFLPGGFLIKYSFVLVQLENSSKLWNQDIVNIIIWAPKNNMHWTTQETFWIWFTINTIFDIVYALFAKISPYCWTV